MDAYAVIFQCAYGLVPKWLVTLELQNFASSFKIGVNPQHNKTQYSPTKESLCMAYTGKESQLAEFAMAYIIEICINLQLQQNGNECK